MSPRHLVRAFALALATPPLLAQSPVARRPLPSAALIRGVPFVSWREADSQAFEHKDIRNPSSQASYEMLAWYWSETVRSPGDAERLTRDKAWQHQAFEDSTTSVNVPTLDSLKAFLARGIPVIVGPALTPHAHPLYPVWDMLISMEMLKGVRLPNGPRSGTLGKMLPLDSVPRLVAALGKDVPVGFNPLNESSIYAARVAIGYDDTRQVLILHDPSFGPAFELGYADFERMWGAADRPGTAMVPPAYEAMVARHATAPERYRDRTPDERAAWDYVNGYALSATGRVAEGVQRFSAGLSIPGISGGYRHLLDLELAFSLASLGRTDEAVTAAQEAARLVPDHVRAWQFLAEAYPRCGLPDRGALGKQAADRARNLTRDRRAADRAAKALPHDFVLWSP